MAGCMVGLMDGWMDGRMNGMDGWNGWMEHGTRKDGRRVDNHSESEISRS